MTVEPDIRDRIAATTAALLDAARVAGMVMSGDLRVCEADAALLLGLAHSTLKQSRDEGSAPTCYRAAVNGHRISYRVSDLASWIESRRE